MTTQTEWMLEQIRNSPYATGADFSHHKGEWDLSVVNMDLFSEVMDFMVLRAGYGAGNGGIYKDIKFDNNYAIASSYRADQKIALGTYWYFSSNSAWEDQLAMFMSYCEGKEFDFYVLDFEPSYNDKSAGFALTAIRFMKELQRQIGDKKVLIYIGKYVYQDWIKPYTDEIDDWYLWHAQYPWTNWTTSFTDSFKNWWISLFETMTKQPSLASSREENEWEIWQVVASSGIGNELGFSSDALDFNITRRTKEDFYAWLGITDGEEPPPPPPPVEDCSKQDGVLAEVKILSELIIEKINNLNSEV